MKIRQLLGAIGAAAALSTGSAQAALLTYMFAGTSAGGVGSATMIVNDAFSAQNILVQLFNTSPLTLPGGGANAPAITGFGFDFANSSDFSLTSWQLFSSAGADCIGSSTLCELGPNPWVLDAVGPNQPLDFFVSTSPGSTVQGGLYNPSANQGLAATPNYFTEARLLIEYTGDTPIISDITNTPCNPAQPCSPFVRMQNVGENGAGSLRLDPSGNFPPTGVPEPGTLALLGMALAAGALARRKIAA